VLDLVTTNAARAIGRGDRYGLRAGGQADLVVLDSERRAEVSQTVPERLYVIKSGRVTHTTTLHRQRLAEPLP
jgi:cytosine deaminase